MPCFKEQTAAGGTAYGWASTNLMDWDCDMPKPATGRKNLGYRFEQIRLRKLASGAVIAGVDEAGIGPWAGPVVAAAVCLDPNNIPSGLADSKLLSPQQRERLFESIMITAAVGIGVADVARIDRDNVLAANHWAMAMAISELPRRPGLALIDGLYAPAIGCPAEAVVDGDASVASIAAASIIAKVTRDRLMAILGQQFPGYGFARHKGYGTAAHREALERLGVAECHRRSYKPVKLVLAAQMAKVRAPR